MRLVSLALIVLIAGLVRSTAAAGAADASRFLFVGTADAQVLVFDPFRETVQSAFPVRGVPADIVALRTRPYLLIAYDGAPGIDVVDVRDFRTVLTIDTPEDRPLPLLAADEKLLHVLATDEATGTSVITLDLGSLRLTTHSSVPGRLRGATLTANGSLLVATSERTVRIEAPGNPGVMPEISIPTPLVQVAAFDQGAELGLSASGKLVWLDSEARPTDGGGPLLASSANRIVPTLYGVIAVHADAPPLWLVRYDGSSMPLPASARDPLILNAVLGSLVALIAGRELMTVDLRDLRLRATLDLGISPRAVAVSADTGTLFVAADDSLVIVDLIRSNIKNLVRIGHATVALSRFGTDGLCH